MKAGRPRSVSFYEYERNGTANLFMMFAPLASQGRFAKAREPVEGDRPGLCVRMTDGGNGRPARMACAFRKTL